MVQLHVDEARNAIQVLEPTSTEVVSISGTAAQTPALGSRVVRVVATADCFYAVNAAATTSSAYLPAGAIEYFETPEDSYVSFITSSATGNAYVTEMV